MPNSLLKTFGFKLVFKAYKFVPSKVGGFKLVFKAYKFVPSKGGIIVVKHYIYKSMFQLNIVTKIKFAGIIVQDVYKLQKNA